MLEQPEKASCFMYRYESERRSICIDADSDLYRVSSARLVLRQFEIISETPKGKWVSDYGIKRWVSNSSRKRYCHETKELAMESYILRKKAYIRHCETRLRRAKEDFNIATKKEEWLL